jgi:hypothetical protein
MIALYASVTASELTTSLLNRAHGRKRAAYQHTGIRSGSIKQRNAVSSKIFAYFLSNKRGQTAPDIEEQT